MVSTEGDAGRAGELPDPIVSELEQSSDGQLHAIIDYAQERLHRRHDPTTQLEPRPGEEIVCMDDAGDATIVVVERTEGSDRGPFMYRVMFEPDVDSGEGRFRWWYIGRVVD